MLIGGMKPSTEFEAQLADAETRLSRLKSLYEQYFQGLERLEPLKPRQDFDHSLKQLQKRPPRNTALKFRLNSLRQRFVTYQTYWNRVARQIEEGTYQRDIKRLRRKQAAAAASSPRPRPQASASSSSALPSERIDVLYQEYIEARRQNREGTNVPKESIAKSIDKILPRLQKKHAGKKIDFRVVVRNGKVGLKPVASE